MKLYFAPMEGVTTYIYRGIHREYFPGMDRYYTPFLVANKTLNFKVKEKKDVAPENNQGSCTIPQLMANKAPEFLWAMGELKKLGYREVNLNLGCPASTVVSKKKGAGFLAYPEELDAFLEEIFAGAEGSGMDISIKTRLGKDRVSEGIRLMEIYNKYPISELTIHARAQKDLYKGEPYLEAFEEAVNASRHKICYNGNIFSKEGYEQFTERFPQIEAIMLGRGIIANPGLALEIQTGEKLTKEKLKAFHDAVYRAYGETDLGEINTLFRMKELWFYMGTLFSEGEKTVKKIRKSKNSSEFLSQVSKLFSEYELNGNYRG